jgi:hypothetical protein
MIAKVRNSEMINTRMPISPVDMRPSIKAGLTLVGMEKIGPDVNQCVRSSALIQASICDKGSVWKRISNADATN